MSQRTEPNSLLQICRRFCGDPRVVARQVSLLQRANTAITLMAGALLDWRLGQVPGAVRGDGGKAKAIRPDAIGSARFPGARLIEANRRHPRGILSGAALFS